MIVTLNHFKEQSWTILHIFGEYLQEVAVVIEVHQNAQFLQLEQMNIEHVSVFLIQTLKCCQQHRSVC